MSDLLNQASLVMVPSGYKEDTVYSVVPSDGSGDLSFTRASNGTRVNSAGLVEVCPWNAIQYSEDFSNAIWAKVSGITITVNSTTAPNGTATADKIEIANGTNDRIEQVSTAPILTIGLPCTFSCYIKSVSGTGKVGIRSGQSGVSSVLSYTNEWQRLTWTFNAAATSEIPQFCNSTLVSGADSAPSFYAWGAQLNIGSTAKPYFPTTDRLNVPRLTYQNGGGGCPSLLLEKQSTNEVQYSQELDNAYWLKYQCSITANQGTSPDGTQNADLLTTSGSNCVLYKTGVTCRVLSYFAKAVSLSSGSKFSIQVDGVGNAEWNQDGTLSSVSGGTATNGENMGNGWFRFAYVVTSGSVANYGLNGNTSTSTALLWGLQNEAGTYPTSYIPSTSSSATRVADACFKTGISSLIGQTEGVMFVDFEFTGFAGVAQWVLFLKGSAGNYIGFYTNSNNIIMEVSNGGAQFLNTSVSVVVGTRYKLAVAYKANDFAYYVNGSQISIDSSGSVPTCSEFDFNYNTTQANLANSKYNQAILFKTRLTNAELASLTTI